MDDIQKYFKKLSAQEYEALMLVYLQLKTDHTKVPGIVKMVGYKNLYRVRVGRVRLIFSVINKEVVILRVANRDENTYRNI